MDAPPPRDRHRPAGIPRRLHDPTILLGCPRIQLDLFPRRARKVPAGGPPFHHRREANVGYSTAFYAHRYPDETIIAIEPSRSNIAQLRRDCSGYRNVVVLERALWPTSGSVRIANPEAKSWSYRVETADDSGGVRAFRLDEFLDKYRISNMNTLKL
jgi:FkbM family methyltransferase